MSGQIRNNPWKILSNILFYFLITILIFTSIFMINSKKNGNQVSILGHKFFIVLTGSMSPTINPGDLVIVKEDTISNIEKNDIVTFKVDNSNTIVTHRAVNIINDNNEIKLITKGDANNVEDRTLVNSETLVGQVVTTIPNVGNLIKFIQDNIIKIIILSIIIIITFLIFKKVLYYKGTNN